MCKRDQQAYSIVNYRFVTSWNHRFLRSSTNICLAQQIKELADSLVGYLQVLGIFLLIAFLVVGFMDGMDVVGLG